jgi:hypothetical protein
MTIGNSVLSIGSGCLLLLAVVQLTAACQEDRELTWYHSIEADDTATEQLLADLAEFLPNEGAGEFGLEIQLQADDSCAECFSIDQVDRRGDVLAVKVRGGIPLGAQYGLYQVLEQAGWRFFTPYRDYRPKRIDPVRLQDRLETLQGRRFAPEMSRRGLHLHTLHTTEALFDFWLAGDEGGARRIVDWVVKNRGNYLQWCALDDINDPDRYSEWRRHTAAVIDYAHRRGVGVGLNTQLFSSSSLQNAYLTSDRESLAFLEQLPFDLLNLSFGEFVGQDPQQFVDLLSQMASLIEEVRPGTEVSASVHVGNFDNLRVDYQGENMLYYFLVKFVPSVIPWVHTVMYYDLYEDAGGAYNYDEFSEHRQFLLERLEQQEPVGYFPESAYWISFDNSVPLYLPLYIRSRWLDMWQTRQQGQSPLAEHVLFSSGWEWGYWQHDYLTLRMNYRLADDWRQGITELLEPLGEQGVQFAGTVAELAELQHDYLIEKRLAAYIAGVDFYIEAGRHSGIISQPTRILVDEAAKLEAAEADEFRIQVLAPLDEFADRLEQLFERLPGNEELDSVWLREIRDGLEVDFLRARYVACVYRAVLDADRSVRDQARVFLERAAEVVSRRHADLHYPHPELLVTAGQNPTIYSFGYLKQAHELCLWRRELVKLDNALGFLYQDVPWCIE